ncbi:hypothetical protein HDU89_004589 [Geranomyces variabilis]|nr:hypothetical protein HDU89_004589 [Geranomyces variabilis]
MSQRTSSSILLLVFALVLALLGLATSAAAQAPAAAGACPAPPASCPAPTNPADPACAGYRMCDADATAATTNLCTQMPAMPGCSVSSLCASSPSSIPSPYCSPMSVLANICSADMPTMSACKPYVNQCGPATNASASVNTQCKEASSAAIPGFPTSKSATQNVYSICHEMSMPGCEACTISSPTSSYPSNSCDLMGTYALLCKAMPDMSQCADWKAMCAATPGLSHCSAGSAADPPVMRMFFHTGFADYVLFESWVPRTSGQYFGTWVAIFILGVFYEGWHAIIATYEAKFLRTTTKAADGNSEANLMPNATTSSRVGDRIKHALLRFVAKAVTVTIAYALMLVAMTFNVGLFFAVVVGLATGSAIFTDVTRAALTAALTNEGEELCC